MPKHQKTLSNQKLLTSIKELLADNNQLILKSINDFSTEVDQKFSKIDGRLSKVESTMVTKKDLKEELKVFATKEDLKKTECRLVTKDYLDDKLADLQADLAVDKKIKTLTNILQHKRVITKKDSNVVFSV